MKLSWYSGRIVASWPTDNANDAARPRITTTSVISVTVTASHIGAPRRRRIPVNGCTPMTRMSASITGARIEANCCSASTLTRSPVRPSTTIRPRGTGQRGSAAAPGSVIAAMLTRRYPSGLICTKVNRAIRHGHGPRSTVSIAEPLVGEAQRARRAPSTPGRVP